MRLYADLRPIAIPEKGRFKPVGPLREHGSSRVSGRQSRTGSQLLAARFLIGFNVNREPRWTESDLIQFFIAIREAQGRSAGATFFSQRGIWQPLGGARDPDEEGAQILILNEDGLDEEAFTDEMATLGEELARKMEQDVVLLDIQKRGVVVTSLRLDRT
jgi:hypothetical protein